MVRAIALVLPRPLADPAELLRLAMVTGCALALIAARQPWPLLGL